MFCRKKHYTTLNFDFLFFGSHVLYQYITVAQYIIFLLSKTDCLVLFTSKEQNIAKMTFVQEAAIYRYMLKHLNRSATYLANMITFMFLTMVNRHFTTTEITRIYMLTVKIPLCTLKKYL